MLCALEGPFVDTGSLDVRAAIECETLLFVEVSQHFEGRAAPDEAAILELRKVAAVDIQGARYLPLREIRRCAGLFCLFAGENGVVHNVVRRIVLHGDQRSTGVEPP